MHLVRRLLASLFIIIGCTSLLAQTARVAFDGIKLRQKPSAESAIVATVKKGAELQVLEKVGTWYRVRIKPSGPEGYISSIVVDVQGPEKIAPETPSVIPAPQAARSASTDSRSGRDQAPPPPVAEPVGSANSSPLTQPAQHREYFTIFISAPERDGFLDTSKDIEDSIKDIKNLIAKQKNVLLNVTDARSTADIVLTVVQRGVGVQAYGQRVSFERYYGGTSLENTQMVASTYWLSTVIEVGKYKKEFTGQQVNNGASVFSFGAWSVIAGQIARNVTSWVSANAEQLRRNK